MVVGQKGLQAGTPASMRALNQRLVLHRLRERGEATRPQIATDTGLSKPTVGQALLDLEQHGLVRATGRSSAASGRAAVVYQAAPDAGHVVGVDIGRRLIRVVVADLDGGVAARLDEPNRCRSATALLSTVSNSVERAVCTAGLTARDVVVTVVGTPGVPDLATRTIHRSPNLPGWERRGVLDELIAALADGGSKVMVENDANLCAVGEHALGAATDVDALVCLTVGTGIGMGLLVDGKLFRGARGAAGEVADLLYPVTDSTSGRRWVPIEALAAAPAVVSAAHEVGLRRVRTAKAVFQLARDGDPAAMGVVADVAVKLAYLVSIVAAVIDPGLVLLAGGIGGGNADLLTAPMRRELAASVPVVPEIAAGKLGEDAILVGAVSMAQGTARDVVLERCGLRQGAAGPTGTEA
jgi:predicted NBD/HSP70 family sugar kinase